jgi:hypothetical protein
MTGEHNHTSAAKGSVLDMADACEMKRLTAMTAAAG